MFYAAVVDRTKNPDTNKPRYYLIASDDPISTAVKLSLERDEDLELLLIVGKFESLEASREFCDSLYAEHRTVLCFRKAAQSMAHKHGVDIVDMTK